MDCKLFTLLDLEPVIVKSIRYYTYYDFLFQQDPKHTVEDLVNGRGSWLSHPGDKSSRLQADLQLTWATAITYIDIGKKSLVIFIHNENKGCDHFD